MAEKLFYECQHVDGEKKARCEDMLDKLIPGLFEYSPQLYVGASSKRFWLRDRLEPVATKAGKLQLDVLEIWPPYCEELVALSWVRRVILGTITRYRNPGAYRVVIWWSGPEHVPRHALVQALANVEVSSRKWVLLACPIGKMVQGPVEGNPYQEHLTSLYPETFLALGYNVFAREFRPRSETHHSGHMIAWKDVSEL